MRTHSSPSLPVACPEWAARLAALHRDDLAPEERATLQQHINICPNCAAVYAQYQQVDARILSLPVVQPSAEQISQLEALIAGRAASEPLLKSVVSARGPQSRPGRALAQHRPAGSRLSAFAAIMVVVMLAAGALALFSSRHPSSVGDVSGTLYTISYSDGTAYALNAVTGQVEWRTPLYIKPDEGVLISHGMIFITSQDGFLYAIRESDGKLLWHRSYRAISSVNGRPVISPSLVSDGKAVYIGAETGLYAWSVSDGHTLWYHAPPAGCNPTGITPACDRSPITVSNGIVYVYFDGLYALRSTDGAVLWKNLQVQIGVDLVVVKNRLYVHSFANHSVYVFQADNGHRLDTIPLSHPNPISIISDGEIVYITDGLHDVYAVRSSDNRVLWTRHYTATVQLLAADDSNLYYVSTMPGAMLNGVPVKLTPSTSSLRSLNSPIERLNVISASNGSPRWSWRYPAGTFQDGMATGSGMLYVVAGTNGGIYALRANDGKVAWHALPGVWLARVGVE